MRLASVASQSSHASAELDGMAAATQAAAHLLKALAHESRLMILWKLCEGEKSVGDLEQALMLRQPTVSQQLARLRADRLVATRREGKTIYYHLACDKARLITQTVCSLYRAQQMPCAGQR